VAVVDSEMRLDLLVETACGKSNPGFYAVVVEVTAEDVAVEMLQALRRVSVHSCIPVVDAPVVDMNCPKVSAWRLVGHCSTAAVLAHIHMAVVPYSLAEVCIV